jgi:DNA-directed RNA polymerase specialized sigma24 family protein
MSHSKPAEFLAQTLSPHLGWFEAWCRRRTARSGVDWRDPFQSGVVYLLQQLERGVLDGVEPSGWRAFTAHTLKLGALQRLKSEWRQRRRAEPLEPASLPGVPRRPEPEDLSGDSLSALLVHGEQRAVRAAIAQLSSPVRRFVLLAVYAPEGLERSHLEEAAAYRRGGARLFVRPVASAWGLLSRERGQLEGPAWKAWVARVVAFRGVPSRVPETEVTRVLWGIDQHLSRGREELAALLRASP